MRATIVVTYYIKLFRTGADRHNDILMSLLLLVAETIIGEANDILGYLRLVKLKKKFEDLVLFLLINSSGGSTAAATSQMKQFVTIVNVFQPLTVITKCSILDIAAALDPPLNTFRFSIKTASKVFIQRDYPW